MSKVYTKLTKEQRRQLYEIGYVLYDTKGQGSNEKLAELFDLPLAPCKSCATEVPHLDGACFVCGQPSDFNDPKLSPEEDAEHPDFGPMGVVCENTGLPAKEMEFIDGPDSGVGTDFYVKHKPSGREFYVNNDQGVWSFSECS